MACIGIQLERNGWLTAGFRARESLGHDETDGLQVIGDVRHRLGTERDQIDDLFSRDRSLPPDHIEDDATVVRGAGLLGRSATDHGLEIIYTFTVFIGQEAPEMVGSIVSLQMGELERAAEKVRQVVPPTPQYAW